MKLFGNKQQLCMGGWVLAALALVGLNGFGYMGLESRPLEGTSMAIRSLRQKLVRLEGALARDAQSASDRDDYRAVPALALTSPPAGIHPPNMPNPPAVGEKIDLPDLSGIVQMADVSGAVSYTAVLNGRACREREKILDFVVSKISKSGVMLTRGGKQWFLNSPAPLSSGDLGQ